MPAQTPEAGLWFPNEFLASVLAMGQGHYVPPKSLEELAEGESPFALVPQILRVEDMEAYLPNPARKQASLEVCDALSFGTYVNKHKSDHTLVTASLKSLHVKAILDQHSADKAGWGEHVCVMQLAREKDWDKWTGVDGKAMSQGQFADFLLEVDHTIAEPSAASIIEIATKLRLEADKKFESKVNMTDGSFTFMYQDEIKQQAGQMKMPDKCLVHVAPFRGAKPVDLLVLIRYRLQEGKLNLFFKLVKPDDAMETAFEQVVDEVRMLIGDTKVLNQA